MGIVMKKVVLLATALALLSGSALVSGSAVAADLRVKALKAPPPAPFEPWDIAFGSALMNDYVFRGITQSNHKASVAAYFEPRYNITKDVQLYVGVAGESISFPNRAAAEIDIYGGIRPTFGMFAFDFGVWGYLYPGGKCYNAAALPGSGIPGSDVGCAVSPFGNSDPVTGGLPINGNFAKKNASFFEGYGKVNITINDMFAVGANEYYSPNFLNLGAWGNYASVTGKFTAPGTWFGTTGIGMYASAGSGSAPRTPSTAPRRSRAAFLSPATTPGTSASASPTRSSPSTSATPTPTCPRVTATPSPAITRRRLQPWPACPPSTRVASSPDGAARPASSSSRLT
jgi:hypothetical protein